ncbi:hypothetical protein [Ammoniphilus sp. 3BR4]|uniref:hypothetical protein n=1 Tax=Ammoniphilus sp. 3BR4 TaxID=3158265 RepID=UPI0034668DEE
MRVTLQPRNASVAISSKEWINTDFLEQIPAKEVIQVLSLSKKNRKRIQFELQQVKQTFESTLVQWMINPQLYRSHRLYASSLPLLDTSALPKEVVSLAYQIIAGLLVLTVLLGIIMSILVSGFHLLNRGIEAEKWQKSIRKGVMQALLAPFIILLLAFVVHYMLQGREGYIPIFKSQP